MIGIGTGIGFTDGNATGGGGVQNIASLSPVSDIVVPYRTAFGTNGITVGLPASVSFTADGGGGGTVDMTWAIGSYNSGAAGSTTAMYSDAVYNIVGTPVETGSITNTGNITDTVQITVKTPWFPLTSGLAAIYDMTQLVTNTTNTFGTVDVSNNITALKALAPGATGATVDLTTQGTAPTLSSGKASFNDTGCFTQASDNTAFDFLSYNSTAGNFKTTVILVCNITDNGDSTNALYGTSGFFAPNNGLTVFADVSGTNTSMNYLVFGESATAISYAKEPMVTTGTQGVYTIQTDNALAAGSGKVKSFKGTTQFDATTTGTNVLDASPLAPKLQLGGFGASGTSYFAGTMSMAIFLNGVESDAVRNKLVEDLAFYTGTTL